MQADAGFLNHVQAASAGFQNGGRLGTLTAYGQSKDSKGGTERLGS